MNELDKIFLKGLENHEVEPSNRAKLKFEEALAKRNKRTRKPWAYFSMAAAMFLMFFTGFWFLKDNNKNIAIPEKPISQITNANPNFESNSLEISKSNSNILIKVNKSPSSNVASKINLVIEPIENNTGEIFEKNNYSEKAYDANQNSNITVSKVLADNKNTENPNYETIETLVFVSPIVSTPKILNNIENLDKTILNNKQEDYFSEDKSLITRFFTELAGIKKGEKVDFAKLGFKSIEEMSEDDESFIVSETKQIKKGYTWIKSKISNN